MTSYTITDLFASSFEGVKIVKDKLRHAIAGGNCAIVGSSLLPGKCARAIEATGGSVRCFIEYDARFWNKTEHGLPVVSPSAAAMQLPPETLIIVGIWSPNHSYAATRRWLASFGFHNVMPVHSLFWLLDREIGPHYQLSAPNIFFENSARIAQVYDQLSDDASRQLFAAYLRWRVTLDDAAIPDPSREDMYFDRSLFRLTADACVVDCGAYDGDSLRKFLTWTGEAFGEFHAFEPDPLTFGSLTTYIDRLPETVKSRVIARQIAVGDCETTITFSASGTPGSQKDSGTDRVDVPCKRLDDLFADRKVDYLKFDIEGAEWDALRGAQALIQRDRPVVATAIYHRPDDLFALPLFVMSMTANYRYYMRAYDVDGIDFVFYAVPAAPRESWAVEVK